MARSRVHLCGGCLATRNIGISHRNGYAAPILRISRYSAADQFFFLPLFSSIYFFNLSLSRDSDAQLSHPTLYQLSTLTKNFKTRIARNWYHVSIDCVQVTETDEDERRMRMSRFRTPLNEDDGTHPRRGRKKMSLSRSLPRWFCGWRVRQQGMRAPPDLVSAHTWDIRPLLLYSHRHHCNFASFYIISFAFCSR